MSGLAMTIRRVDKEYVFEPSAFDPPEQDQYEYWVYSFDVDGRDYTVRRYCDEPEEAHILSTVRNADAQALGDARTIARFLIEEEGVRRVNRYNTRSGVFDRRVDTRARRLARRLVPGGLRPRR
jgi:hypothetical protein